MSDKYKVTSTLRTDTIQKALEDTLKRIARDGEKPFLLAAKARYEQELARRTTAETGQPADGQPGANA